MPPFFSLPEERGSKVAETMDRREFLALLAGLAQAGTGCRAEGPARDKWGVLLPQRPLTAAGTQATCLGLGGYHIGWTTEALARHTIEAALAEGVRFFDTAESYGPHTSEERYGKFLVPRYRNEIVLMTKSTAPDAKLAQEHLEGSLRRLGTDVIDIWQIHALQSPEDAEARLNNGVLDFAIRAQKEGKIRWIGFTGHASPYAHLRMIERTDGAKPFAVCQFPINPVDAVSAHSFVRRVLPKALECRLGVLAMKTLADGRFFADKTMGDRVVWKTESPVVPQMITVEDSIHFALSLPIAVLITGAEKPEFVREKAGMARSFRRVDDAARAALAQRVVSAAEAGEVEYYKDKALKG